MFRVLFRQGSLLNPFIQALPFALLIIFFVPDIFNKYQIEINKSYFSSEKFIEFDGDGNSEFAVLDNVNNIVAPIPIVAPLATLNIYSLHNNEPRYMIVLNHPWSDKNNLFSADINKDKKDEIFIFTRFQDSVFLEMYQHYSNDSITSKSTLVKVINRIKEEDKLKVQHLGNSDLTGDGSEEFIFMFLDERRWEPQNIYAWDIKENVIIKSPDFGISINVGQHYICDIDEDGMAEILLSTSSNKISGNFSKTEIKLPYPDTSAYILVLDHDLNYLFEPIPVKSKFLYLVPIQTEYGINIVTLLSLEKKGRVEQEILFYNVEGKLVKSKTISNNSTSENDWIFTKNNNIDNEFYLSHTKGLVEYYNVEIELKDCWKIKPLSGFPVKPIDLDGDGDNEFIFWQASNSIYKNEFIITQQDLSHSLSISLAGKTDALANVKITNENNEDEKGSFLIQISNENTYLCTYSLNPTYKFKYFIWAVIYIVLILFITLIQWAQRVKTQNRTRKEKELAEFQLMAIKNQIDPHFTLNTLNAISSLYGKGENQEAYKYMTRLSRLMLLVLNESDQISSMLKAEVEMIKNYIELQLIRFKDSFSYTIEWDEKRLGEREIPRMLIHTFTENAIKHGLRLRKEGGILKIKIFEKEKHLFIVIEDNGVGRRAAALDKSLSSGKGMGISEKICQLYQQLRKVKVNFRIDDLFRIDELTKVEIPNGTRVTIIVYPKLFKI